MYRNFHSQNLSYLDTCIANICIARCYFCCLLVNNIVYINIFSGDLPAMNICLHAKFQVWWC